MNMKNNEPIIDPTNGIRRLFHRALDRLPIVHEVTLLTV